MNSVALAAIRAYQAEVDAGRTTVTVRASREGETTIGTIRLTDDRYDWLRTTAFYARTSINALVVAALTRAQAVQAEGTTALDADGRRRPAVRRRCGADTSPHDHGCRPPGRTRKGRMVLVVDDDRATARLIREVLELEGYPVRHAGSSAPSLDIAWQGTPAVILLDLTIPGVGIVGAC